MDGTSEAAASASTRRRTSGLAVAVEAADSVAAATATRSGADLAPAARGLVAAPRALREAPGERGAHAFPGEHRVEGVRLGRLAGFDQDVELQRLAHVHDLGAAVDGLLGERDGERVVRRSCSAS